MQALYFYDLIMSSSPFHFFPVSAPKIIFGSLETVTILNLGQLAAGRETLHGVFQKSLGYLSAQTENSLGKSILQKPRVDFLPANW